MQHITFSNLETGVETDHTLSCISIDLLFNHLPLDSILYYEFQAPTISGYSGRRSLRSNATLDAAVHEWTALCDARRQNHIDALIVQLRHDFIACVQHDILLTNTHVLAGDRMGVMSLLHENCDIPERFLAPLLASDTDDDHLMQHLTICHHLITSDADRMTETDIISALLQCLSNLFEQRNGNALAKTIVPIIFDMLSMLSSTKKGRAQLGVPSVLQIIFNFLDYANNKGEMLSSQIPIAVSILASALFQSSSNIHYHHAKIKHENIIKKSKDRTKHSNVSIPFPNELTDTCLAEVARLSQEATRLDVRTNALFIHITHFNSHKHQHTDHDVEANVRLMFITKNWAKAQLDVPGLTMRYLAGTTEQKIKYLQNDPNLDKMTKLCKSNEPELYEEMVQFVEVLQKRHQVEMSRNNSGNNFSKGHSAPPQKNHQFKNLLDERECSLHEIMLVCLIGLWHYLRDCHFNVSKTLSSILKSEGVADVFAMCQATEYPEVQRCAFGVVSELCRLGITDAYHRPVVEQVVVLVEKQLYALKKRLNAATKTTEQINNGNDVGDVDEDDGCSNPLLYLALQFAKNDECRNILLERNFTDILFNFMNLRGSDHIITIRTCSSILLYLHDPQSIQRILPWGKMSICDDSEVAIYITQCLFNTLSLHDEAHLAWKSNKGIELILRRLSKLINIMKRTGRNKINIINDPVLLTLLKSLLGVVWISIGRCDDIANNLEENDQFNTNMFVVCGGVNLVGYFLRWKDAPECILKMALQILWMASVRSDAQEQMIRVSLVRVLLTMIKQTAFSFEIRSIACNIFEVLSMKQRIHVEKDIQEEHALENILMHFLNSQNKNIVIYGLAGLARIAFASKREATILVNEMYIVPKIFNVMENNINIASRLSHRIYGEYEAKEEDDSNDDDVNNNNEYENKNEDGEQQYNKEDELQKEELMTLCELREERRSVQLIIIKCLHVLMNITVVRQTQVIVAKLGLALIFDACRVDHSHPFDRENENLMSEMKLYAERVISNLSKHEKNRTPMYKMELKLKAKALKQQEKAGNTKKGAKQTSKHPAIPLQHDSAKFMAQKKRIQERRDKQMQDFLHRQKMARYANTNQHASLIKYESKYEKWKEQQKLVVRPPSIFAVGLGSNSSSRKNNIKQHVAMRPSSAASSSSNSRKRRQHLQQQQLQTSQRLSSATKQQMTRFATTTTGSVLKKNHKNKNNKHTQPKRPQSAHLTTRRVKTITTSTPTLFGRKFQSKQTKNELIRTLCRPMIDLFNHGIDDDHRCSKIRESINGGATTTMSNSGIAEEDSVLGYATLHPVHPTSLLRTSSKQLQMNKNKNKNNKRLVALHTNEGVISSYLKPLQYSGEDDYTPWTPRIAQLQTKVQYSHKPQDEEPIKADGNVPVTPHSPGKPPSNNASKDTKVQYLYNLQKYVERKEKLKKGRNELIFKPAIGEDQINLMTNPLTCTLSNTVVPFEFQVISQYSSKSSKAMNESAFMNSQVHGKGVNGIGNITLQTAASSKHRRNYLSTWKHCSGATVYDDILDRYLMDDGREMYFFHQTIIHEQESPSLLPNYIPASLFELGLSNWWHDPIAPNIHNETTWKVKPFRHATPILLSNTPSLQIETDRLQFLVGKNEPMPVKMLIEKPPYLPPVFLLRYATSETESLYNERYDAHETNVQQQSFEKDWKRMQKILLQQQTKHQLKEKTEGNTKKKKTEEKVEKTVKLQLQNELLQRLKVVVSKNYSIILRLFVWYAGIGDGSSSGIQLNAYRSLIQELNIMKKGDQHLDWDALFLNIDAVALHQDLRHNSDLRQQDLNNIDRKRKQVKENTKLKTLVRFEFVLLLISLSQKVYSNKSIDHGFHLFMKKNIIETLNGEEQEQKTDGEKKKKEKKTNSGNRQILMDQDDFREHRLYTRSVNKVLQHFLKELHLLFVRYSGSRTLLSGHGVALFLDAIKEKVSAKKRWKQLKKKRKSILIKASRGFGKGKGNGKGTLMKKKILRKMGVKSSKTNVAGTKEQQQSDERMIKMMAPKFVRDITRDDALIALAGYHLEENGTSLHESLLPLNNFLSMLHELSLIGAGLSVREATRCFSWSLMHIQDELTENRNKNCLSFVDFLECLGRLAELIPLPTMHDILKNQHVKTETTALVDEDVQIYITKHSNLLLKTKKGELKRRESSKNMLEENKVRGLDEKLFILLSVLQYKIQNSNMIAKRMNESHRLDEKFSY